MKQMKRYKWELFTLCLISLYSLLYITSGCTPSTNITSLSANKQDFIASVNGDTLKVVISSDQDWIANPNVSWLKPNVTEGAGEGRVNLTIRVEPNFTKSERKGVLEITTADQTTLDINVSQGVGDIDIERYQYEIPVIFHVLYNKAYENKLIASNNPNDPNNTPFYPINSRTLQSIIDAVNDYYKGMPEEISPYNRDPDYGHRPFTDMNVKFTLASVDPQGKRLNPTGILRHEISENSLSVQSVMSDKEGGVYHKMGYPIHKYINVFIFPFTADPNVNGTVLGISHIPHGTTKHPISGLASQDNISDKFSNYNFCVAINSRIFEPMYQKRLPHGNKTPEKTIAHELGHMLGLFHVFSEEINKQTGALMLSPDQCIDSDHVDDTFSYNRINYINQYTTTIQKAGNELTIDELTSIRRRFTCDKKNKLSTNIMDYDWSYNDRFTEGQKKRMRETLYYSLSIPGIKLEAPSTLTTKTFPIAPCHTVACKTELLITPPLR